MESDVDWSSPAAHTEGMFVSPDKPDWYRFEQSVADALVRLGWSAQLTKASNDFGADIVASWGTDKLVVQCKYFANTAPVQSAVIREVMVAKTHYQAKLGLIAYRGIISKRTFEKAMDQRIAMLTLAQLVSGCFFDKTMIKLKSRTPDVPIREELEAISLTVVVTCPACGKLNRLPKGRDGVMTCGHCRTPTYQRT